MNAEEIQAFSQSIAFHPIVAIGGLMVLISIARKMDLNYKEAKKDIKRVMQAKTKQVVLIQDKAVNDSLSSFQVDSNNLKTSTNT